MMKKNKKQGPPRRIKDKSHSPCLQSPKLIIQQDKDVEKVIEQHVEEDNGKLISPTIKSVNKKIKRISENLKNE